MSPRVGIISVVVIVFFLFSGVLFFSSQSTQCSESECVVAINSHKITENELKHEIEVVKKTYASNGQNLTSYASLPSETREALIEKTIVTTFAQENDISVSQADIVSKFQSIVAKKMTGFEGASHSNAQLESDYLSEVFRNTGLTKEEYFKRLEYEVIKEKVKKTIKKPYAQWLTEEKEKANILRNHE